MTKPAIYVAAPWEHKANAKAAKTTLEAAGYTVTSHWIDLHTDVEDKTSEEGQAYLQEQSRQDLKDVLDCHVLVLLNLGKSEGKSVETGLAIAWCKPVIIVGPRTNIFHWLPLHQVETLEDAMALIEKWTENQPKIISLS